MRWPMPWPVGWLLLLSLTQVWAAEESPAPNQELQEQYAYQAYDQVTVRFNTNIKAFPSWEAFKSAMFSRVSQGTVGRCYALTGDVMRPIDVTQAHFQWIQGGKWQQTSGKGWRQYQKDHTFTEYRVNQKADVLLQAEGTKPWFFFAHIQKICEFPL